MAEEPNNFAAFRVPMNRLITLLALGSSTAVVGQKTTPNVPPEAKAHFAQHYPKAKAVEWEQGAKHINVEFDLGAEGYKATYTAAGSWVRTEHDIPKSEIPPPVSKALKASKYATWKLEDEEEHNTPKHPSVVKLKLESETQEVDLFFLPDGTLLKEEVKERKSK